MLLDSAAKGGQNFIVLWGYPQLGKSWGYPQNSLDGFLRGKNPKLRWMFFGGTPISGNHHIIVIYKSYNSDILDSEIRDMMESLGNHRKTIVTKNQDILRDFRVGPLAGI